MSDGPSPHITLNVDLGDRSYPIHIGSGLLNVGGDLLTPALRQKRVFIVTDSNVAPLYLADVKSNLAQSGIQTDEMVLPAGEATKNFAQLQDLIEAMLAAKVERSTAALALGGGVIGDLTGFAAAVTLRGMDFIQVPTTLLAQVDSSVGGKTGINTAHGKNLAGSFHQPRAVLIDTDTITTLPDRERRAGYAEVCKYGLLGDAPFWDWLEKNGASVLNNESDALTHAISVSCTAKAKVVAEDEKEHGTRALLNLGHTFGHAFEAEFGYSGELLHGEAVALGMTLAFDLSVKMGLCPAEDAERVRHHLQASGLPTVPPRSKKITSAVLMDHMAQDKKVKDGRLTLILARGIGQAFITQDVDPAMVQAVLDDSLAA